MNAILRQIILLVMLITLFEQLLPEGKMKQIGKMGLGLVMLLMLVTFLSDAVNLPFPNVASATVRVFKSAPLTAQGSYRDAALMSYARQLAHIGQNTAHKAGYPDAIVTVTLFPTGDISGCQVAFSHKEASALYEQSLPDDLRQALSEALRISSDIVIPAGEVIENHGV